MCITGRHNIILFYYVGIIYCILGVEEWSKDFAPYYMIGYIIGPSAKLRASSRPQQAAGIKFWRRHCAQ